jgi:hypothetical protein
MVKRLELLKLEWQQVNFERCELRLKRSTTKNRTPRTLPFYGDMELYPRKAWSKRPTNSSLIFVEDDGSQLGRDR